jgi:transcription elongation factor Elf1
MNCPACEAELNASTGVDHDVAPEPGDFSICLYCGAALEFSEDRTLQPIDEASLDDETAEDLRLIRETLHAARSQMRIH